MKQLFTQLPIRIFYLLALLLCLNSIILAQPIKVREPLRFLALGDSYTIGQSVSVDERWPNQLVAQFQIRGYSVEELKIIAQTGWRTDNLRNGIQQQMPLEGYNLVSLLIGVNNQYQGGTVQTYMTEFEELLQKALELAGNDPSHVFVLSIPDYAYTPLGNGSQVISAEIDLFNSANRFITETYDIRYVDITPISRNGLNDPTLVAGDGLHPSGKQYGLWVQEVLKYVEREVGLTEKVTQKLFVLKNKQLVIQEDELPVEVIITDLSGREMLKSRLMNSSMPLQMLNPGIFILQVRKDNEIISQEKIYLH
ncbi:MAG: SGNH/GDSL hydrolase family protein [Bacteroidales bacterium]|nr:SGNH/GDSL hydrolase family protein [Bacteroidales bacterium]